MKKRNRLKRKSIAPELILTPLIDTSLTLLVIFMVTAPMASKEIKVSLPQAKGTQAPSSEQKPLVVTVDKAGSLFFNSDLVQKESLVRLVKAALDQSSQGSSSPVYIRADETISYGQVVEIVDELKQAGISQVAMSTRAYSQKAQQ